MQKIKLHVHSGMLDYRFFEVVYDYVDVVPYDDYNDIFVCDRYNYPLVHINCILNNVELIKDYFEKSLDNKLILLFLYEGTNTVINYLTTLGLLEYFKDDRLFIISSGDFDPNRIFVNVDYFTTLTSTEYNKNVSLSNFNKIYETKNKPYKFLFLNKRLRDHRTKLREKLEKTNLLDFSLWSDIANNITLPVRYENTELRQACNLSPSPWTYEMLGTSYQLKHYDGIIFPKFYIDTYFSVITETNFELPYSYCTEKIYKPILMGAPFIAVSSYKFYQHLKDRGYKTFGHLIDESFDNIYDNNQRLNAISNSIYTLCQSDLDKFMQEAKPICEYNRQHFFEEVGKVPLKNFYLLTKFFNTIVNL